MITNKDIQLALKQLGLDPGPIDGVIGKRTRVAVREFQSQNALLVDGIVGPATRGALAAKTGIRAASAPIPATNKAGRLIHTIVVHCTATPEGKELTRAALKAMHLARGFSDIGYHKFVHLDGKVEQGRPDSKVGAHVAGHNTGTLGISYVGGVTAANEAKDTRTTSQRAALIETMAAWIKDYPTIRAIVGHRDLSPDLDNDGVVEPDEWVKECPCFNAIPEYAFLLK